MSRFSSRLACIAGLLIFFAVFNASAQDKPLLSAEIAGVLETRGVEAAKQHFAEIYPAQKDAYEVDLKGLTNLGMSFMQGGNMEAGMAVIEMTTVVNMAMMTQAMNSQSPEMMQVHAAAEKADQEGRALEAQNREQAKRAQQQDENRKRGESRGDLARFTGLYGDPADTGRTRTIFVTVSCDGYLVTGPMWADVNPWWMRSAADTVFTYADSFTNLSMEFTGGDGAYTLKHDLQGVTSPMERLDDLPADWPDCQERPLR